MKLKQRGLCDSDAWCLPYMKKSSFCSTFLFVSKERFCPTVDHLSSLESLSLHSAVEAGRFTWLLGQHEAERIGADPHHFLSLCLLI
jgi:hypothetical protein